VDSARGRSSVLKVIESRVGESLDPALFRPDRLGKLSSEDVMQLLVGLRFELDAVPQ
jgi:hypothetical protein